VALSVVFFSVQYSLSKTTQAVFDVEKLAYRPGIGSSICCVLPRVPLPTPWLLSAENYFIVLARINWRNRLLPFLKLNWTATQLLCLWSRATTKAPLSYRAFAHALHTYSPGSPPPSPYPSPRGDIYRPLFPRTAGIPAIFGMRLRTIRHGHGNLFFIFSWLCFSC